MANLVLTSQRLLDKTRKGKLRPWKEKKQGNVSYARYLKQLHFTKAHNVAQCGDVLTFKKLPEGRLKLFQTWFCKSKLCPLCNWRRSLKSSNQLQELLQVALQKEPTGRFLFLTLTQENSSGKTLKQDIARMSKAVNRLLNYKKVSQNLLGYVRSLEVTVNDQDLENITYHSHFHVLLFMKREYFSDSQNYLEQAEWTNLWRRALKVDYQPIVHIQAVKKNAKRQNKNSLLAAAQETAKYQVKSSDILTGLEARDLEVIEVLEKALAGTRQISFGGLFKKLRHDLQLDDAEDGNLIDTDSAEDDAELGTEVVIAKWDWKRRDYYIVRPAQSIFSFKVGDTRCYSSGSLT